MNVEHLRLFVRLASTLNISQAGQELSLSPAVASAHISKLEQALGVRLVHRTTRKVALTEEGVAFLPHAQEVLASVEAARAAVGAGSLAPQGTLRVSAPASFGRMHLVPRLKDFLELFPQLSVDLRLSDSIIDLVEGGFDIAIRNAALKDSTLVARKLASDHRLLTASPSYLAQHGEPQTPHDLVDHNCIQLMGLDVWQFQTATGIEQIKAHGNVRADNGEAIRDACSSGLGITINSTWSAYQQLQSGELVPVLSDYPLVSETAIWAVYPSTRMLAPKVRAFIDYFAECFGDEPYWDKALAQHEQ
ncbi:LysR family transcriptional regulator [Neiella marina]|uniref:LysR family transcriptional regulator n=1 Tax=Neiella holothuriorum TaxID=2870530 RepID=A0ABS7ELX5_9GAMM|nr:LysR family transcriptional regulator [Neiella holothuriorum]MBW8192863.1 LysR family transcriptional regulator [Neiella holothuriorum]